MKTLLIAVLSVAVSPAAVIDFYTNLGPEAVGATGTGVATFRFDTTAQTLALNVNFSGLSGITTVAHIHGATAVPGTGTAGVITTTPSFVGFPVGVQSGTFANTLDLTLPSSYRAAFLNGAPINGSTAAASAYLLQSAFDGTAYLNIHSSTFPGGEIRGFLQPVPEPTTFALAGLALAGLGVLRRYRSR